MNDAKNLAETLADVLPVAKIVYPAEPAVGDILHIAVPKAFELKTIDTEALLLNPRRTVLSPGFADAASFVAYIKRHATPATVLWTSFDPQLFKLGFTAVFDDAQMGIPGWRKHRATFTPDMSAEWKAWKSKDGSAMKQVEFAEWLQEHDTDIATDGNDGMPTSLQMLDMATNFVMNEERQLKSVIKLQGGGVRLNYIADSAEGTEEAMRVFEKFQLGLPVFHGGNAFYIKARLKYRKNNAAVSFHYELIRADRVYLAAASKLIDDVQAPLVDANVPMFFGTCPA